MIKRAFNAIGNKAVNIKDKIKYTIKSKELRTFDEKIDDLVKDIGGYFNDKNPIEIKPHEFREKYNAIAYPEYRSNGSHYPCQDIDIGYVIENKYSGSQYEGPSFNRKFLKELTDKMMDMNNVINNKYYEKVERLNQDNKTVYYDKCMNKLGLFTGLVDEEDNTMPFVSDYHDKSTQIQRGGGVKYVKSFTFDNIPKHLSFNPELYKMKEEKEQNQMIEAKEQNQMEEAKGGKKSKRKTTRRKKTNHKKKTNRRRKH